MNEDKQQAIFEEVREILSWFLGVKEEYITLETELENHLELDSSEVVEVAMELEDEYHIDIPDSDLDKFTTVRDVVEYIAKKVLA